MIITQKMDMDGKPLWIITTDKSKAEYQVKKSEDGFVFYDVGISVGSVPAKLSGKYTTPDKALKDVRDYIRTMPVSKTVERDIKAANREKRKNAKTVSTDDTQHIQQGSSD